MSLHFIIHKEKVDDIKECSAYIIDELINAFPGIKIGRHYHDMYVTIGSDISIDFRCGADPCKMAGIRPEFYYSDNELVAEFLELGACKVGGKRFTNIDSVIAIIIQYLKFKRRAYEIIDMMDTEWEE
jgi:hypothetical protein